MRSLVPFCLIASAFSVGCASAPAPAPTAKPAAPGVVAQPEETHLQDLKVLIAGGENAEAYWGFNGRGLSMQRRGGDAQCDRIYTMTLFRDGKLIDQPQPAQVSSGKGATTCAHFFPGDQQLLYASTHLGGDACPPRPDMSQGYVWALYDSYEIFKANADGSQLQQLTRSPGYDAEGISV